MLSISGGGGVYGKSIPDQLDDISLARNQGTGDTNIFCWFPM